jgi:hypothetical protein
MIDDERELERRLREVAAAIQVPSTRLRRATAGPNRLLVAASVAAVVVAAVLVGRGLGSLRNGAAGDATAAEAACPVTPITTLSPTNLNFPIGGVALLIGGRLAAAPFNLFSPDHYWYLRDSDPQAAIVLRAERLDAPAPPALIAATGYYLGDGFPTGWSRNWYYRTSVISADPFPSVGCWRIAPEDDPQSAVVYYLKLQDRRGISKPDVRASDPLAQLSLEVDGYRFTIRAVPDESYTDGSHADIAAHVSGVTGLGLECQWTRVATDVPSAQELWGPASTTQAEIAGYAPVRTGSGGDHIAGVPEPALLSGWPGETDTVCALRDDQGTHGVVIMAQWVRQSTSTRVLGLSLTAWRRPVTSASAPPPAPVLTTAERLRQTTGIVVRADRTSLIATTRAAISARTGDQLPAPSGRPDATWVLAILGEINQPGGPYPCGVFYIDPAGSSWGAGAGPLSACQPYFADSLTPPDAPLSCPAPFTYGVELTEQRATRPGPVALDIGRDDSWRRSSIVPGAFLLQVTPGGIAYQKVLCFDAFAMLGAAFRTTDEATFMLGQATRPTPDRPPPGRDYQVWLKDLHVLSASVDSGGTFTFRVERRPGFEMVGYDPTSVLVQPTGGGYVRYRFVDASGKDVIPFIMDNIP